MKGSKTVPALRHPAGTQELKQDFVRVDRDRDGRIGFEEFKQLLECAYKLQQYADRPCRKRSTWKETWPGPRQVYRQYDPHERICRDQVAHSPVKVAPREHALAEEVDRIEH